MNTARTTLTFATLLAALTLLAPGPARACHEGTHHKTGLDCGGGGGGSDGDDGGGAKRIESRDTFGDAVGDAVASDGFGSYEHKVDGNVLTTEQHILQTGRLDKSDRTAFLNVSGNCTDVSGDFNPFRGLTELTLAARADLYTCDAGSCDCDDLATCAPEDFGPALGSIDFQAMAGGEVAFIAAWAVVDPDASENEVPGGVDLNKSWLIFDAGGLLDVPTCDAPGTGLPARVECTSDGPPCTSWTMTGLDACWREQGDTTPATIRANCVAPFEVTIVPKP